MDASLIFGCCCKIHRSIISFVEKEETTVKTMIKVDSTFFFTALSPTAQLLEKKACKIKVFEL